MKLTTILFVLLSLLMTGCGKEGNNNHGYGYYYDAIGETGLRLRHAEDQSLPTITDIESLYFQVANCMGLDVAAYAAPLVVMAENPIKYPEGTSSYGVTYLDTGLILIRKDIFNVNESWWLYKHEFVHYLLQQTGFPSDNNLNHLSSFFRDCVQPY
jgi:hypothetical protein